MNVKNLGMVALGGLFVLSLSGCAAAHAITGDGMDDVWVSEDALSAATDTAAVSGATADATSSAAGAASDTAANASVAVSSDVVSTVSAGGHELTVNAQLVESTLTAEEEATSPMDLQIVDSGWFVSDNGMVDFALGVQNPNHTVGTTQAVIEVVGKDDAGNVIFDETIETPGVLPDSVYYYSYVAGSTAASSATSNEVITPTSVEFTVSAGEDSWVATEETLSDVYTVNDNGANDTQFGAKEFTGTVTASEALNGATQSRVDVLLLDADGHIEGGYFKIVDTTPGQAIDYDIYAVGAPEFASYAVYASPWGTSAE